MYFLINTGFSYLKLLQNLVKTSFTIDLISNHHNNYVLQKVKYRFQYKNTYTSLHVVPTHIYYTDGTQPDRKLNY